MDMGLSCRKNALFPGAHKIGAAISGPRIAGKQFYGHEDFSEKGLSVPLTGGGGVRSPYEAIGPPYGGDPC